MFPEDLVKWYASHGYQFLGLSEHDLVADHEAWIPVSEAERRAGDRQLCWRTAECRPETRVVDGAEQFKLSSFDSLRRRFDERGKFLLLQNEEISSDHGPRRVHVNAVNVRSAIAPSFGDDPGAVLEQNLEKIEAHRQQWKEPMLGIANHPTFTWALSPFDLARVKLARFVEIFNGHPYSASRGDTGRRSAVRLWDVANAERVLQRGWPPLYGIAADDTHALAGAAEASPGRGWITVKATRLRADELIESMLRGDFYASTGVTLRECDYDAQRRKLTIAVAPADGVSYQVDFFVTKTSARPISSGPAQDRWDVRDVGMLARRVMGTRAEFELAPDDSFVRATITASSRPSNPIRSNYTGDDAQFEQAFTQPVGWQASAPASVNALE